MESFGSGGQFSAQPFFLVSKSWDVAIFKADKRYLNRMYSDLVCSFQRATQERKDHRKNIFGSGMSIET